MTFTATTTTSSSSLLQLLLTRLVGERDDIVILLLIRRGANPGFHLLDELLVFLLKRVLGVLILEALLESDARLDVDDVDPAVRRGQVGFPMPLVLQDVIAVDV